MEQGPKIINLVKNKKELIETGEHFKAGRDYEFNTSMRVLILPRGDEVGGGANIPVPAELPAGRYRCLGFSSEGRYYRFLGQPVGEEEEVEVGLETLTLED